MLPGKLEKIAKFIKKKKNLESKTAIFISYLATDECTNATDMAQLTIFISY